MANFAYISNYGGGSYNTITVVDLATQKTLPIIDLGALRGPHGLDFVGGKLWFTAEGAKVIGSYDPATKTNRLGPWHWPGSHPHGLRFPRSHSHHHL